MFEDGNRPEVERCVQPLDLDACASTGLTLQEAFTSIAAGSKQTMWIVKPAEWANRGCGISSFGSIWAPRCVDPTLRQHAPESVQGRPKSAGLISGAGGVLRAEEFSRPWRMSELGWTRRTEFGPSKSTSNGRCWSTDAARPISAEPQSKLG